MEIMGSLHFFVDYIRGKPSTRHGSRKERKDFAEAFGLTSRQPTPVQPMSPEPQVQSEEAVLLKPYHVAYSEQAVAV